MHPLRPSARFIFYSLDVVADSQGVKTALKKDKDSVVGLDSESEDRQSDDSVEEIKEPAPKKSR